MEVILWEKDARWVIACLEHPTGTQVVTGGSVGITGTICKCSLQKSTLVSSCHTSHLGKSARHRADTPSPRQGSQGWVKGDPSVQNGERP